MPDYPQDHSYYFCYDKYARLINAYSSWDGLWAIGNDYETTYDYNGNLTWMQRGYDDPMEYVYKSGTNIPQSVGGYSFSSTVTGLITNAGSSGKSFSYDAFTQMPMQVAGGGTTTNLQYDSRKERVYKEVSMVKTLYIHGVADFPIMEKTSTGTERLYIYGQGGLVAMRVDGVWRYVLRDHLGSTAVVASSSGAGIEWYVNDPYGYKLASHENTRIQYQFTGHELETSANGEYYNFRARNYDPVIGLFYGTDPAHQTFSPFGYVGGNPVTRVDRDGRWFMIPLFIGCVLGDRQAVASGQHGWQRIWTVMKGASVSVASAAVGYGVGTLATQWSNTLQFSTSLQSISSGAFGGAAFGGTHSILTGQNVGRGLLAGFLSGGLGATVGIGLQSMDIGSIAGSFANIMAGGLVGGAVSSTMGGSFEEGFENGLVSSWVGEVTGAIARYKERMRGAQLSILKQQGIDPNNVLTWEKTYEITLSDEQITEIYNKANVEEFALGGRIFKIVDPDYANVIRLDDLHMRIGQGLMHFDHYGLTSNPIGHFVIDHLRDNLGWHIPNFINSILGGR